MINKKEFKVLRGKGAAAHIEIIFAFLIFVGFVIFLLYYIQPFKTDTLEDAALVALKESFFKEASVNLTTVLVNFSANGYQPCRVTNIPGIDSSLTHVKAVNTSKSSEGFYYLYYTDGTDFTTSTNLDSSPGCAVNASSYGDINELIVLSDYKLNIIKQDYLAVYDTLKVRLGLPPNADFTILSADYVLEKRAPDQIKVIAGAYRKQVLGSNATLINKDFIIKVW